MTLKIYVRMGTDRAKSIHPIFHISFQLHRRSVAKFLTWTLYEPFTVEMIKTDILISWTSLYGTLFIALLNFMCNIHGTQYDSNIFFHIYQGIHYAVIKPDFQLRFNRASRFLIKINTVILHCSQRSVCFNLALWRECGYKEFILLNVQRNAKYRKNTLPDFDSKYFSMGTYNDFHCANKASQVAWI